VADANDQQSTEQQPVSAAAPPTDNSDAGAAATSTQEDTTPADAAADDTGGPADSNGDEAPAPITGQATLRYNHYTKEVTVTWPPGSVTISDVNELFSLSYGFKGNYVIHLRGPGRDGALLPQTDEVISGVEVGSEYWCEVDEDPIEAAKEKVNRNPNHGYHLKHKVLCCKAPCLS
jgi:hypothetical protein